MRRNKESCVKIFVKDILTIVGFCSNKGGINKKIILILLILNKYYVSLTSVLKYKK